MNRSSSAQLRLDGPGPFRAEQLSPKSRYELHDGHPIYCAPTGGDGARATVSGAEVLDSDPEVKEAGIDPGYSFGPQQLHAPDIAIGDVPDEPGWIAGIPPLAVEYASAGQNEAELQEKIEAMILTGTRWVWVVRLTGERRVEVYQKGKPSRVVRQGSALHAPGVLRNPVLVEELFDRKAAHAATLRNLLQRKGYESLDAVLEIGSRRGALLTWLEVRRIEVTAEARARVDACRDGAALDAWIERARTATTLSDVLG